MEAKGRSPNGKVTCDFIVEDRSIYMTGSFFRTLVLEDTIIISKGNSDGYLIKLDASGEKLWAVSYGGPNPDKGESLTSNKKDLIMLVGSFQKELETADSLIHGFDADDIFMATTTTQGVISEVEAFGGLGSDNGKDSEMIDGSLVIAGYFRDAATVRDINLQSAGSSDILLTKLQLTSYKVTPKSFRESETILKFYPNPAAGKFIISATENLSELGIFNTLGQPIANVKITKLNKREAEITTGEDFKGVCIVKGVAGKDRFVSKVIIE